MRVVAFVPIKLVSERLPNKNILPLAKRPLCWHMCNSLTKVDGIDAIYVYCSDEKVMQYIPSQSIRFKQREKWMDGNEVKGFEIYKQFIQEIDADIYILAHTTSPLIKPTTIQNALNKVLFDEYDSAFSAKRVQTFAWYQNKPINYDLSDVPRTQDMEPIWVETSAFYIFRKEIFTKHHRRIGFHAYIQETSEQESIDIDERSDYNLACKLIELGEDVCG